MANRKKMQRAFIEHCGLQGAKISPLAADASFRSYHRVNHDGRNLVLMDAPPPQEDVRPFCAVAKRLLELGLSAPDLLGEDVEKGFLLLEDFGDQTFSKLLASAKDPEETETALYDLAMDVLIALHRMPNAAAPMDGHDLPEYDEALYLKETALLPDWFLPAVKHKISAAARAEYDEAWRAVLPRLDRLPKTLVLRDFHVDNLMRLPGRDGIAACGLLDFQDAVYGPALYDVVSLLEDARRDVSVPLILAAQNKYLTAFPDLNVRDFAAGLSILGAQRHAKVIGIFARLNARDKKPDYLKHIPRVWELLEVALEHSALGPVADWFDQYVPVSVRRRKICP